MFLESRKLFSLNISKEYFADKMIDDIITYKQTSLPLETAIFSIFRCWTLLRLCLINYFISSVQLFVPLV